MFKKKMYFGCFKLLGQLILYIVWCNNIPLDIRKILHFLLKTDKPNWLDCVVVSFKFEVKDIGR